MHWLILLVIVFVVVGMFGSGAEAKKKKDAEIEGLRRRKEAEDYIMASGDQEAIKMLMLARANPANYSQVLAGGMGKGNDTLKTAMGVMAGVAVGNLVANAVTASVISDALASVHTDLASSAIDSASSGIDFSDLL